MRHRIDDIEDGSNLRRGIPGMTSLLRTFSFYFLRIFEAGKTIRAVRYQLCAMALQSIVAAPSLVFSRLNFQLGMQVLCKCAIAALFTYFPEVCISHILPHKLSRSPYPHVGLC